MSFAYGNNGLSFRTVTDAGSLLPGEVFFEHVPSPVELQEAFPGYVAGVVSGLLASKIESGCEVVSQGTPSLNATYAIDSDAQIKVLALGLYIAINAKFPAGQTSWPFPDQNGKIVTLTSTAEFLAIATAIADYVAGLYITANSLAMGQILPWPDQPTTIA